MLKIPPDYTFLIQIGLFVVFWLAMKPWAPRRCMKRTRVPASMIGTLAELGRSMFSPAIRDTPPFATTHAFHRDDAAHAAALETVKAEAHRDMQIIVREAEAEQQSILADARSEAERRLADARIRIAEEMAVARRGLRVQVEEIAREVVRKVLGRAA